LADVGHPIAASQENRNVGSSGAAAAAEDAANAATAITANPPKRGAPHRPRGEVRSPSRSRPKPAGLTVRHNDISRGRTDIDNVNKNKNNNVNININININDKGSGIAGGRGSG
jgi:hypothetical protein